MRTSIPLPADHGHLAARADLGAWIQRCLRAEQPRSKSLIVTVLGDAIVACGGAVWLGDLIRLLEPFGVNQRLVRTSVSRLAEEGWIEAQRDGRRSRYALTASGMQRFEHAFQRIYRPPPQDWDGRWTQVLLLRGNSDTEDRAELKRELQWEGYGLLAPGIFLHPAANRPALDEIFRRLQLRGRAMVLQAYGIADFGDDQAAVLARQCWNLEAYAQEYRHFLATFEPLQRLLASGGPPPADQAFAAQTLLVHAFRRVSLHDPRLPAPMLPPEWPGHTAYRMCSDLYRRTQDAAWRHLAAMLEGIEIADGPRIFARRFE